MKSGMQRQACLLVCAPVRFNRLLQTFLHWKVRFSCKGMIPWQTHRVTYEEKEKFTPKLTFGFQPLEVLGHPLQPDSTGEKGWLEASTLVKGWWETPWAPQHFSDTSKTHAARVRIVGGGLSPVCLETQWGQQSEYSPRLLVLFLRSWEDSCTIVNLGLAMGACITGVGTVVL